MISGVGTTQRRPKRDQSGRDYSNKALPYRSADYGADQRPFIAWDGEGINLAGAGKPQSYVLFGSTEGHIVAKNGLSTIECLEHIIETGQRNPRAFHVGFAFSYDVNMICKTLSPMTLTQLHRRGTVKLKGAPFRLTFAKGKFFTVTKYLPEWHIKKNPKAKITVKIEDVFSFFACSFIKAYEQMVGPVPDLIKSGKAGRAAFSLDEFGEMESYWALEVQMMKELAEELRRRVYNADLRITQWYGPGALSTHAMRKNGIKSHMADCGPAIREAARFAYAGGRFELFKCGRISGRIYSYDINSAYPFAISQLPSLTDGGTWIYVANPTKIARFGVYHVRQNNTRIFAREPGYLFHRDTHHNISFPWQVEGWYWSPEASLALRKGAELVEGWEYRGGKLRPFNWIPEMYTTRQDWKLRGISAQIALKLCMNSCYGKLAQRVGWTPENNRIPPFHQLEWAGWVTSYTRAMLYTIMARIPFQKLIAVETDGIYTTMSPEELGISASNELGGWEIQEYEEILYVQSGLAWVRDKNGKWTDKRRGLDPCRKGHDPDMCDCSGTFSLNACRNYLENLHPKPNGESPWPAYSGETTRFVGMGQALARKGSLNERHCVWETVPRIIKAGGVGKRRHMWSRCDACAEGATAYEMAHDLVIFSAGQMMSTPHNIPWEGHDATNVDWRDQQEDAEGYVYPT